MIAALVADLLILRPTAMFLFRLGRRCAPSGGRTGRGIDQRLRAFRRLACRRPLQRNLHAVPLGTIETSCSPPNPPLGTNFLNGLAKPSFPLWHRFGTDFTISHV